MFGGTPKQCLDAGSLALSNLLGLVCDPIAGLVEAPCQNRNSIGATNALICAQQALAGIKALIPFDEMVEAMYHVGRSRHLNCWKVHLVGVREQRRDVRKPVKSSGKMNKNE